MKPSDCSGCEVWHRIANVAQLLVISREVNDWSLVEGALERLPMLLQQAAQEGAEGHTRDFHQ